MLLKGKNVIITGTNRGIGRAMLEEFAKNGANIWAHARELTPEFETMCIETANKYGGSIRPLCFELTNYDAMKGAVKQIVSSKNPVDVLVNNAGITYNALFQMSQINKVKEQMEVNFFSPYIFTQFVLKIMLKNNSGSIVNIASIAALDGNSGKSAYGASKAALIVMTKAIAEENGRNGIRANCIAPGIIETEMINVMPDYIIQDYEKASDLRKIGNPRDIAKTAVFLASDLSSHITGQIIRVDGGMNN